MPSQTDLDQGGTSREMVLAWRGPSVGYIWVPKRNLFTITTGGTFNLDPSTNYVEVNTTGAVIIVMPSAVEPAQAAGAMTQPGLFHRAPITIADIGGNAAAHPITIQRNNANESIMGLAQIQITVNFGAFTLAPNSSQKVWNNISP